MWHRDASRSWRVWFRSAIFRDSPSPLSFLLSSFRPLLLDWWRRVSRCAPWILFLYITRTNDERATYRFFLSLPPSPPPPHCEMSCLLSRAEEKWCDPVNKVRPETNCGEAMRLPLRLSAITSESIPYTLIVSSRSAPSSNDVISRWSLHEYILWLRRFTNKLNICFNLLRCLLFFPFKIFFRLEFPSNVRMAYK